MEDGTTLLFDLPGFRVVECVENEIGQRHVLVMGTKSLHACPDCGVAQAGPYDHRESTITDLPFGHRPLSVRWRKRRFVCAEPACPRRIFTETSTQVPPRHRLTLRLRRRFSCSTR